MAIMDLQMKSHRQVNLTEKLWLGENAKYNKLYINLTYPGQITHIIWDGCMPTTALRELHRGAITFLTRYDYDQAQAD